MATDVADLIQAVKEDHASATSGTSGFLSDSDTLILRWLNDWVKLAADMGIWVKRDTVDANTTGYTDIDTALTDLVQVLDCYWAETGEWLQPMDDWSKFEYNFAEADTGTPTHRMIEGGNLYYLPLPESTVSDGITVRYAYHPGDLTALGTALWTSTYDRASIAWAVSRAFLYDRTTKRAREWKDIFEQESLEWTDKLLSSRKDLWTRIQPYRNA